MADPANAIEANDMVSYIERLIERRDAAEASARALFEAKIFTVALASVTIPAGSLGPAGIVHLKLENDGGDLKLQVAEPKAQRREPFPNPEAVAYRPKV